MNKKISDTVLVRIKDLYKDSLKITALNSGSLLVIDTLKVHANIPFISIDPEKIKILDKDSLNVPVKGRLDHKYNIADIIFNKTESQSYRVQLLPGALTGFFEETNDTINYRVTTKATSDFGTMNITLKNADSFPLIVQLVDPRFNVIYEEFIEINKPIFFDYISPGNYYIRLIYDENGNEEWDTGNFLKGLQPEKIIYYPSLLDIRANWSLDETFILN
jgi:hypothetical protein